MKGMKKGMLAAGAFAALCAAAITIADCDHLGTINDELLDLKYSVEVTGSRASLSRAAADDQTDAIDPLADVELYIEEFEYIWGEQDDNDYWGLVLIINYDRHIGGFKRDIKKNSGWYSVHADLQVLSNIKKNKSYPLIMINFSKMRVNGREYEFRWPKLPEDGFAEASYKAVFGRLPSTLSWSGLRHYHEADFYPDNFSGFTITDGTESLKTIITIDPEILSILDDENGCFTNDPFQYIKVETRLNE